MSASVDVDRVAREVDFQTLQDNTSNVTFCDIQAELEPNGLDPNFIKLFRLAQLIIEYLVYSQDCLSSALSAQEQQLLEKTKEIEELKEKLDKQIVKNKKADGKPSYIILDGNGGQYHCNYCPKVFLNETYLRLHFQRRHPEHSNVVGSGPNNTMEKELEAIKEQLKITESCLLEEKASVKEQIELTMKEAELRQEMETWKVEQIENHRKELSSVREQFLYEIKILNDKYLSSEIQLQGLKHRAEPKPHSGTFVDEDTYAELVRHHQQEMILMREQMKEQVSKVETVVRQQFEEKDKLWQMNLRQLEREHSEEIHKLTDALYRKMNIAPAPQAQHPTDKEISLTHQIETLEELNRKQQQKLLHREKRLQEISNYSPPKHHSSPVHTVTLPQPDYATTQKVTKDYLENDQDTTVHSMAIIQSAVRHNPNIIQGMREEVSNLLEKKLERIGIPRSVDGVKDSTLSNKLASQQSERQSLTKRYKSLLSLREQLQHQVEWIARSRIKGSKTVPSTPSRAKKSVKKLFNSMRERVKSVTTRSRSHSPPRHISLNSLGSTQESNFKTSTADGILDQQVYYNDSDEEDDERSTDSGSSEDDSKPRLNSDFTGKFDKKIDSEQDENDSSESEDSSIGPRKKPTRLVVSQSPAPRLVLPQPPAPKLVLPQSPSVAQLAASLEQQLEGRKAKPLVGVDLMSAKEISKGKSYKNEYAVAAKVDQYRNGLSSSLEDIFNANSINNNKVLVSKGEAENSSNTGTTSVWGSSASKQTEMVKQAGTLSRPTSSLVSVSSWDSDNDISDLM